MKKQKKSQLIKFTKHDVVHERDLYEQGAAKKWLKKNHSYQNVFLTVQKLPEVIKALDWEIAYGYVLLDEKTYLRHCFFVKDDKIIDTNRMFYEEQNDTDYIVFWKADIYDYAKALLKGPDERNLALYNTLEKYELEWFTYAEKKQFKSLR